MAIWCTLCVYTPFSSFFVGLVYGNKATIGIPFFIALPTTVFNLSTLYLKTFGIDLIDSFLFFHSIMKIGKEDGQGVGYLEDGSMVVINPSADMLGSRVLAKVKSVISTTGNGWFFSSSCEKQLADHALAIVTSDPFTRSLRLNSLLFLDLQLSCLNRLE